jgi:hypothetical protein
MTDTVKDLISAIVTGNAVDTESAFNAAMAEKLATKLDDMRVQVAQNMFNVQHTETETEAE